jgi:outer membrane protein
VKNLLMAMACALAACAAGAAAADAPADSLPRPIGLDEALRLARQNAVGMIQAVGQVQTSAASVRSAYAAFLPSVSVSAGASRRLPSAGATTRIENGQVVTLPDQPWSFNMGLGANVTLFGGGQRLFDLRQAKARATAADINLDAQQFATSLDVKQRFFDVLAARETEAAARAQLAQAEQNFRVSTARVRARTATLSDSLRSDIQLRNARLALTDAQNGIEDANAALSRSVGATYPVTAALDDSLEPVPIALSDAELTDLAARGPAVHQAEASLQAARAAKWGTWSDYLPSVSASYSRSGSGTGEGFATGLDNATYSGSFRLSMSLPLFDQLQREGRVTQGKVGVANAEASLRDAQLGVREEMARYLATFRTAGDRIEAQNASVRAAEEDLRVQQQRYAVGASTLLDVLTSEAQLDQARRDLISARYDQRIAKAEIEALVGREL